MDTHTARLAHRTRAATLVFTTLWTRYRSTRTRDTAHPRRYQSPSPRSSPTSLLRALRDRSWPSQCASASPRNPTSSGRTPPAPPRPGPTAKAHRGEVPNHVAAACAAHDRRIRPVGGVPWRWGRVPVGGTSASEASSWQIEYETMSTPRLTCTLKTVRTCQRAEEKNDDGTPPAACGCGGAPRRPQRPWRRPGLVVRSARRPSRAAA